MSDNPFHDAIDVLDERGWVQDGYDNADGVCLVGAVRVALHDKGKVLGFGRRHADIYKLLRAEAGCMPEMWNDHPSRTEEDVRLLLKRAAYEWGRAGGR